jgi:hypothetical protein
VSGRSSPRTAAPASPAWLLPILRGNRRGPDAADFRGAACSADGRGRRPIRAGMPARSSQILAPRQMQGSAPGGRTARLRRFGVSAANDQGVVASPGTGAGVSLANTTQPRRGDRSFRSSVSLHQARRSGSEPHAPQSGNRTPGEGPPKAPAHLASTPPLSPTRPPGRHCRSIGHSLGAAVDERPGPAPQMTVCSWIQKLDTEFVESPASTGALAASLQSLDVGFGESREPCADALRHPLCRRRGPRHEETKPCLARGSACGAQPAAAR